jgi:outer membrane receptor protein involved in Fe transport
VHSAGLYATDTLNANRFTLTLSGRWNRTLIDNLDRIQPQPGTGSLTGKHLFRRFNPAAGVTYRASGFVSLYAGVTEGSRAPSSIELGCADPEVPCKLPNTMQGDPPLNQVVTRTFEAGARGGSERSLRWNAGWFRSTNRDDILFVTSGQTGLGYFKNYGQTRRQGIELGVNWRRGRVSTGAGYTLLDATFRSAEQVNGSGNSTNEEAEEGVPGVEGTIDIEPGDRIPLIPRHIAKIFGDVQVTRRFVVDADVVAVSSSFARGNENNRHAPDGRYYLGQGSSPGYGVANLAARFTVSSRVQLFAQINNLFNRRYSTAAQLGPTGFTATGNFIARPFPAIDGEFPLQQSTFFAPGAPRGAWAGLRVQF